MDIKLIILKLNIFFLYLINKKELINKLFLKKNKVLLTKFLSF